MSGEQLRQPELTLPELLRLRISQGDALLANAVSEEWPELASRIVAELDTIWEEMGMKHEQCTVKGYGLWSELPNQAEVESEQTDTIDASFEDMFNLQLEAREFSMHDIRSEGFAVHNFGDDDHPRVWYMFQLEGLAGMANPTVSYHAQRMLFALPAGISIVAESDVNEAYFNFPLDDVEADYLVAPGRVLNEYSHRMVRMVSSTGFRRMKRRQQLRAVDNLISEAETKSLVREAEVMLDPQYAYIPEVTPIGADYRTIALGGACVSGVCLGLAMPGRERLTRKAVRRDSDLFSKRDGLSLSVEIEQDIQLKDETLAAGKILHIPISGQRMDAVIEIQSPFWDIEAA